MNADLSKEIQEREFRELYTGFYQKLVHYAFGYVFDQATSEDIVQEVFVNLWEKVGETEIKISLKSYVYTAVKNRCIDYLRSVGVTDNLEFVEFYAEISDHYTPDAVVENSKQDQGLFAEILKKSKTFPSQMEQIFQLWFCEGYKQTEIANKLNLHKNTVQTQLKRAKEKICKDFVQRYYEK